MTTVKEQIRTYLHANRISLEKAAGMIGSSKQYLSQALNRDVDSVPAKLVELIDALGLTLELKVKA